MSSGLVLWQRGCSVIPNGVSDTVYDTRIMLFLIGLGLLYGKGYNLVQMRNFSVTQQITDFLLFQWYMHNLIANEGDVGPPTWLRFTQHHECEIADARSFSGWVSRPGVYSVAGQGDESESNYTIIITLQLSPAPSQIGSKVLFDWEFQSKSTLLRIDGPHDLHHCPLYQNW